MKIPALTYVRPSDLDEAVRALQEHGFDAKLLAGGQSLLPLMAFRLANPYVLVDITGIAELQGVTEENDHVVIGAGTRMRDVEQHSTVAEQVPLLTAALGYVGHVTIRNRGTIGGTIAHADPAAEVPTALVALGGHVRVAGPGGVRQVAAEEFFVGPLTTALDEDEVLTHVSIPRLTKGTGVGVEELTRRHGDFALALGVAAIHLDGEGRIDQAHVGAGGLDSVPVRLVEVEQALSGKEPTEDVVTEAAALTEDAVNPSDDVHAPAAYRKQVSSVVVARAINKAVASARKVNS